VVIVVTAEPAIEPARDGDLAAILPDFERFWGDHPDAGFLRHLHHPVFFREFADTAFVAPAARMRGAAGPAWSCDAR
jgi:hypothetical protein